MSKNKSVLTLFTVDAFANEPFEGNQAAVVLVPFNKTISQEEKQKIAAEMNISETAFITSKNNEDTFENAKHFKLQWFTPTCEVSLCGHATLASAAVLFTKCGNKNDYIEFLTKSGILKATFKENKFEIDLPAYNSTPDDGKHAEIVKAIVGSLNVEDVVVSDSEKLLIRLSDKTTREELESLQISFDKILPLGVGIVGVIVTLNATEKSNCKDNIGNQFDFISRYFAPWLGVNEDPVTGSAHSVLAPYWAKILGKNELFARQCSSRGGNLVIKYAEDRVFIKGNAVVVIEGLLHF